MRDHDDTIDREGTGFDDGRRTPPPEDWELLVRSVESKARALGSTPEFWAEIASRNFCRSEHTRARERAFTRYGCPLRDRSIRPPSRRFRRAQPPSCIGEVRGSSCPNARVAVGSCDARHTAISVRRLAPGAESCCER